MATNMIDKLGCTILTYSKYSEYKKEQPHWMTVHERAAGIPFDTIDQQISDEWVRTQTRKGKGQVDGLTQIVSAV
jgi:hypothetical protein